jgi:hypothetical protein
METYRQASNKSEDFTTNWIEEKRADIWLSMENVFPIFSRQEVLFAFPDPKR